MKWAAIIVLLLASSAALACPNCPSNSALIGSATPAELLRLKLGVDSRLSERTQQRIARSCIGDAVHIDETHPPSCRMKAWDRQMRRQNPREYYRVLGEYRRSEAN